MADCHGGMKCNCNGSGDDSVAWSILGPTVLLIVGFVVIFYIIDNVMWRINIISVWKILISKIATIKKGRIKMRPFPGIK